MLRTFTQPGPASAGTPIGPRAPEDESPDARVRRGDGRVVSRPRNGTVRRKRTSQGISYSIRWKSEKQAFFHYCGGSWEGWDDQRAEQEREYVMAKVNRGEYVSERRPADDRVEPATVPSFQVAASNWLHRQKLAAGDPTGETKTIKDLIWRLTVVMDEFGSIPIDRLGFRDASDLVAKLQQERLAITRASEQGAPLTEPYVDARTGRTHRRRRRGLSNGSIRKALEVVERVLDDANARDELTVEVRRLKKAVVRVEKPRRSSLEVEQIVACTEAARLIEASYRGLTWEGVARIRGSETSAVQLARELHVSDTLIRKVRRGELWTDRAEPRNRNDIPRHAIFITFVLAGPRVAELCALQAPHVDTATGRVSIAGTKTEAADRVVPLVPALRDVLLEHRMDVAADRGPAFPTRHGTNQNPDNIRTRILKPICLKANALLEAEGRLPIAHLTPHTLRRTFASILAVCNVPPRRATYLLGHTDPTLTMRVYNRFSTCRRRP